MLQLSLYKLVIKIFILSVRLLTSCSRYKHEGNSRDIQGLIIYGYILWFLCLNLEWIDFSNWGKNYLVCNRERFNSGNVYCQHYYKFLDVKAKH